MTHDSFVVRASDDGLLTAPAAFGLVAVPDFVRVVGKACRDGDPPRLVLDLSEVVAFDTAMLSTMVWARRRCIAARGDLCLVLPDASPVFTLPEVTAIRQHFQVAEDVAAGRVLLEYPTSCRHASATAS